MTEQEELLSPIWLVSLSKLDDDPMTLDTDPRETCHNELLKLKASGLLVSSFQTAVQPIFQSLYKGV